MIQALINKTSLYFKKINKIMELRSVCAVVVVVMCVYAHAAMHISLSWGQIRRQRSGMGNCYPTSMYFSKKLQRVLVEHDLIADVAVPIKKLDGFLSFNCLLFLAFYLLWNPIHFVDLHLASGLIKHSDSLINRRLDA